MIEAQGGDPRIVDEPDRLPLAKIEQPVPSPAYGVVARIDAEGVGYAAVQPWLRLVGGF